MFRLRVVLVVSLFSVWARAESTAESLEVSRSAGAESCPEATALEHAIEQILERPLHVATTTGADAIAVAVAFARKEGGGYTASVGLRGAKQGERRLSDSGPTCADLAQGVAVTIALLLDERKAPEQVPGAPSRAPADVDRARPPAPTASSLHSGWIGIAGGPAFGLVGAPSLVVGPEFAVELHYWSFRVGAEKVLSRTASAGNGEVTVGIVSGHAAVCHSLARREAVLRPSFCLALASGALRGDGHGYATTNRSETFAWLAGGAGAELGGSVGRFVWGLEGVLLVPLRKQTFSVDPAGIAYDSNALGALLVARVGFRLW